MDEEGNKATKIFSPPYSTSLRNTEVGEAVLLRRYPSGKVACMAAISNKMEEDLYSQGIFFPEAPPELHPGGYYG